MFPRHGVALTGLWALWIFLITGCDSWQISPARSASSSSIGDRRDALQKGFGLVAAASWISLVGHPSSCFADENSPLRIVKVSLQGPTDSLGVQIYNTQVRGQSVVAIQRVIIPKFPKLQPGMILQEYASADALIERLARGPFPVELEFLNLAAGGDAISDLGTSIVTPQDALTLAQRTEQDPPISQYTYSKTIIQSPRGLCKIQSRRGDVLELIYEAKYTTSDGRVVRYDASSFRGTGQPYQMVLGSGDMIPGVDQALYDMCPGEARKVQIPPQLAYGPRARDAFKIPIDYRGLEWNIELVSIEGTIRSDNNDQTRQEREGRAAY
jgi:hypothetical protein